MVYETAVFTVHAREQMRKRGIAEEVVWDILAEPESILPVRTGRIVVQGIVTQGEQRRLHLVRIFVDVDRTPPEIVTVYATSKIAKYRSIP